MYTILFNQKFFAGKTEELLEIIGNILQSSETKVLGAVNVFLITESYKDSALKSFYTDICDIVTVDGRPLVYLSRVKRLSSTPIYEMTGGPGLWTEILNFGSRKGYPFFFIGSNDEILENAKRRLILEFPELKIVGTQNGYFEIGPDEIESLIEQIRISAPKIIFLGMSSPKKEIIAKILKSRLEGAFIVLIGGAFDYFAGSKKLAPKIFSYLCLEWVYRLLQEPRRLFFRYVKSSISIVKIILKEFFFAKRRV